MWKICVKLSVSPNCWQVQTVWFCAQLEGQKQTENGTGKGRRVPQYLQISGVFWLKLWWWIPALWTGGVEKDVCESAVFCLCLCGLMLMLCEGGCVCVCFAKELVVGQLQANCCAELGRGPVLELSVLVQLHIYFRKTRWYTRDIFVVTNQLLEIFLDRKSVV